MKTTASWNQRLPLTHVRLMFAPAAMAGLLGPLPATPAQAKNELYAVTTASLSTKSATLAPIRGLSFRLPAASAQHDTAIVTLDMPNVNLTRFLPRKHALWAGRDCSRRSRRGHRADFL